MSTEIILNPGQQEAADGFFEFMLNKEPAMIISGGGGVGKTKLMGHLIDKVMPNYFEICTMMGIEPEFDMVEMCSTTNQSANVLSQATGRPCRTIHSLLNLKVQNDYTSGKTFLTRTKSWKVHERKVIFIDECSTEDPPLLNFITEGTHKCKVVHVGDHCQLGPVGYTMSPLYKLGLPFYELTQPMRNADQPALMALCLQLRTTVETGEFLDINLVRGVIDHVDDSEMDSLIHQHFTHHNLNDRILAYTNDRVIQYNDHIRSIRSLPYNYIVGENLINNSAIKLGGKFSLSVDEEITIVSQSDKAEDIYVGHYQGTDINITVRRSSLLSRLGILYTDVPLPIDRNHVAKLLTYYGKAKNWERYYFIKENFPELRPRDAATIHKAQGSSYDTVFVDVGNLSTCHNPALVARLLYVAISRARSRVVLYGELASKYGRIVNE